MAGAAAAGAKCTVVGKEKVVFGLMLGGCERLERHLPRGSGGESGAAFIQFPPGISVRVAPVDVFRFSYGTYAVRESR